MPRSRVERGAFISLSGINCQEREKEKEKKTKETKLERGRRGGISAQNYAALSSFFSQRMHLALILPAIFSLSLPSFSNFTEIPRRSSSPFALLSPQRIQSRVRKLRPALSISLTAAGEKPPLRVNDRLFSLRLSSIPPPLFNGEFRPPFPTFC